jgi:sensor histidine kinase YesM
MTRTLRNIFLSRIALHIYFWIFIFFSFSILYIYPEFNSRGVIKNLVYFPADIAFTYFFLYGINQLITRKKKYLLFILIFTLSIIGYTLITFSIDQYIIPHILGKSQYSNYNLHTFFHSSWVIVMIALAAGYIKMIRTWHRTDEDKIRLELEKTQAYNQLLRSKINPHFLFNTLNNINSLLEFDKEKAKQSIIGLGDLMAYMVYEADADFVPLEKEIRYIHDFINLQSLRIENDEYIEFNIEGNPENLKIASMILIPFIENAFKYCDKSICPGIVILLKIRDSQLDFYASNNISAHSGNNISSSGFGIKNVKKRLEQIYPGKYELSITSDSNIYQVKLRIELNT